MKSRTRHRQQGYVMIWVALMVTLVMVALIAELPQVRTAIRRDREQELIHRGAQYARAIRLYYKKFGSYPARVEQLQDTNKLRFLRKKYKDPITGEDFRVLHFGDVKLQTKSPGSPAGPGVIPAGPTGPSAGAGTFGQPMGQIGPDGQPIPPDQLQQGQGGQTGETQGGTFAGQGTGGLTGQRPGVFGQGTQGQQGQISIFSSPGTGPTFGGGPIVGVASKSTKESLHIFNEKDHYNDWEFIFDPNDPVLGLQSKALISGPYNGPPKLPGGAIQGTTPAGQPAGGISPTGPTAQPPTGDTTNPYGQRPLFR